MHLGPSLPARPRFKNSLQMAEGVTLGHLKEAAPPNPFAGLFGGGAPPSREAGQAADTYVFINATCVELLNVKAYVEQVGGGVGAAAGEGTPCGARGLCGAFACWAGPMAGTVRLGQHGLLCRTGGPQEDTIHCRCGHTGRLTPHAPRP